MRRFPNRLSIITSNHGGAALTGRVSCVSCDASTYFADPYRKIRSYSAFAWPAIAENTLAIVQGGMRRGCGKLWPMPRRAVSPMHFGT